MNCKTYVSISLIGLMLVSLLATACATPQTNPAAPPETVSITESYFRTQAAIKNLTPTPKRQSIKCPPFEPLHGETISLNVVLNFVQHNYPEQDLPDEWNPDPALLVTKFGVWTLERVGRVASHVTLTNSITGFKWEGDVNLEYDPETCHWDARITERSVSLPAIPPTKIITPTHAPTITPIGFDRLALGRSLATGMDYRGAIVEYTKAIALRQDYAEAFYYRGRAYEALHDFTNALADYSQAIEINPTFDQVYYYRGVLFQFQNEDTKAISDLEKFIVLSRDTNLVQDALWRVNKLKGR